jgi:ribonuclease HI
LTHVHHSTAYCDGSSLGNPGPSGWAFLLERPDGSVVERSGSIGHATNQVAELMAAIEALAHCHAGDEVHLYSDSKYVVEGLKSWLDGWKRRDWRTAAGGAVANETLWRRLDDLRHSRHVKAHWVKGHAGHPQNERVDTLARMAAYQADPARAAS